MELLLLLDLVNGLSEEEKAKVYAEEYERQCRLVNALCDARRNNSAKKGGE